MKEIVLIASDKLEAEVTLDIGTISFTVENGEISTMVEKYRNETSLKVSEKEDSEAYGIYENLTFKSANVDSEGNVTLQFAIQTDIERRIVKLEKTQLEQDDGPNRRGFFQFRLVVQIVLITSVIRDFFCIKHT